MSLLFMILVASVLVSLASFAGVVLLFFNKNNVHKFIPAIVALAAGSLLGTAFFHLLPEAIEHAAEEHVDAFFPLAFVVGGILLFFVIERFIHWHHHHDINCKHHALTTLSLFGDAVHNFIDGALIAVAFSANVALGISSTIAILLHELPQEIGDFAILLHGGYSKMQALLWNFASALFAVLGAVLAYAAIINIEQVLPIMLGFVAGGFIYIALVDIVPELHANKGRTFATVMFLVGIALSLVMATISHGSH